jgi:hypothetical protein
LCGGKLQYDAENIGEQCQIETAFCARDGACAIRRKIHTLSLDFFPGRKVVTRLLTVRARVQQVPEISPINWQYLDIKDESLPMADSSPRIYVYSNMKKNAPAPPPRSHQGEMERARVAKRGKSQFN